MKGMKKRWYHTLRHIKRARSGAVVMMALLAVVSAAIIMDRSMMSANYTALLAVIAKGESRGNYNAYFGNANNSMIDFTRMKLSEVLLWQREFVESGQPSNAVGKYQFIRPTLEGLVAEMHIDTNELFDGELQDRLAIRLIERRGLRDFLRGRITREQFAHNLSKEWAALPRVIGDNPSMSYYAGDGLNKAHIGVPEILAAIESLRYSPSI